MTPNEFARLSAQGFTRIPLHCEVVADFESPLSTFVKLANKPFSFLLESVQGGEKWSRFSIIGLPCSTIIRIHGHNISVDRESGSESFEHTDPLTWIDEYQQQFSIPDIEGLPKVTGGLVGYFGYDTVRLIEPRLGPNPHPDPLGNPDILLMEANELVVFDNLSGKLTLLVLVDPKADNAYENGVARISGLLQQLNGPLPEQSLHRNATQVTEADFKSSFTKAGYKKAVETIRQYITDGECMQVVLSQRLSVPFEAAPLDLYRALRILNPSPYMFYLNLGDHQVVGASPEILVRLEEGEVTVRPLAGTRARGATPDADLENEKSLMADPKELAEHLMLIDLGRNDIGRIAQTGTVEVTDKFSIERYSHVMHIVSNVVGKLNEGLSPIDVLRATFPAGTLSGAPKVRALEILQELEVVKRGVYSGAVGYLSWNGNMDTSIAIRTAVIQNGELHVQAGAGIVYDSDPDAEWAETMSKARAIFKAVALAHAGLNEAPAFLSDKSLVDQSLADQTLRAKTTTQDQEASS